MDACNGLRDLSAMVALYRFPRDIESLRARVRFSLMTRRDISI